MTDLIGQRLGEFEIRAVLGRGGMGVVHAAGDLAASDFTHINALNITVAGRRFDHMVYHFVLTYSNWESVTVCASESFEALSDDLQNALWDFAPPCPA